MRSTFPSRSTNHHFFPDPPPVERLNVQLVSSYVPWNAYVTDSVVAYGTVAHGTGQVDEASVVKDVKQYTYMDGDSYVFMDMVTFEEVQISSTSLGDNLKWLKEGMECTVLTWRDKVITIELPINVQLKVTQADPGLKGDTAGSGATKACTVETGASVQVPLFVEEGDTILVDTRTGNYMSRV